LPTKFELCLLAYLHGEAISLSSNPESDISQKICSQLDNPTSTVWIFLVLGRILRFDYLQFCISTAELYQPSSQSIVETNYKASFSFSQNRNLNFFLIHSTTLDDVS